MVMMSDAQQEDLSLAYLAYTWAGALAIVACLITAGARAWPVLPTLLGGAVVQVSFRTVKRLWRRSFRARHDAAVAEPWSRRDYQQLGLAYVVMVGVCALWYGIGWLVQKAV
jgi:hypothetical protein